jgi:hypothetical protein
VEELEDEIENHIPGSTTNLGERQLHTPYLTLIAQAIFADELQLSVPILSINLRTSPT